MPVSDIQQSPAFIQALPKPPSKRPSDRDSAAVEAAESATTKQAEAATDKSKQLDITA